MKKNLIIYAGIPALLNLLLIGMYYSGIELAQHIVSPILENLPFRSWREFGILEQLQNLFLLAIIVFFIIGVRRKKSKLDKTFFAVGAVVMIFIFLEEIDYGVHFYSYLTGNSLSENFNWHNQHDLGKRQNGTYLKKVIDLVMIIWFIFFPLLARKIKFQMFIKSIVPSPWFIVTLLIGAICSNLAHYLDSLSLDIINGIQGSLHGNTSEFREANTYYIWLLYALQLFKTDQFFQGNCPQKINITNILTNDNNQKE